MNKWLTLLLLNLLCSGFCLAQPNAYRYKRTIAGAEQGWNRIVLPDSIFSRLSPGLADLRILGITNAQDSLEMPYLLRHTAGKTTRQEIPFKLLNQSRNSRGHFYTLALEEATALNELVLKFGNRNFDWQVSLEGSHQQQEWFRVLEDYRILSIHNQHTRYSFTTLRFPTIQYKYLRLQLSSAEKPVLQSAGLYRTAEQPAKYQTYPSQFRQQDQKQAQQSVLDIALALKVPVAALSIQLKDAIDYYRPLSILYPADSTHTAAGWQYHYRTLFTGTLSSLEEHHFSFPATLTKKLRVILHNGHNLPLTVTGINVQGYHYSLLTRLSSADTYLLLYGNPQAAAPEYDIARFEDKIPPDPALASLAAEEPMQKDLAAKSPLFTNKIWLWALMLLLILLMGWFTLKMLRTAPANTHV